MSWDWTDDLIPELTRTLADGEWLRIEEASDEGWLLLARSQGGESVLWYRLREVDTAPEPITLFDDHGLRRATEIIGSLLQKGCALRVLAHKIGRRAVLEVELEGRRSIWKIYRKDRALRTRWTSLKSISNERFRSPRVECYNRERRLMALEHCPGDSLHRRWIRGEGRADDGTLLADLTTWMQTAQIPEDLPVHDVDAEIKILQGRLPIYERTLRTPSPRVRGLVEKVCQALAQTATEPPVFTHRDLHDKQVLVSGNTSTIIDLDLAAAAPAALDPGNMLAHVRLRSFQYPSIPWSDIASHLAEPLLRTGMPDLAVWTASTLTRLVLIYPFRRHPERLIEQLAESANRALTRTGEWSGIL